MNVFNKNDPTSIGKARKLAEDVFGEGWEEKGADISLLVFGNGDGGGGPLSKMLENVTAFL